MCLKILHFHRQYMSIPYYALSNSWIFPTSCFLFPAWWMMAFHCFNLCFLTNWQGWASFSMCITLPIFSFVNILNIYFANFSVELFAFSYSFLTMWYMFEVLSFYLIYVTHTFYLSVAYLLILFIVMLILFMAFQFWGVKKASLSSTVSSSNVFIILYLTVLILPLKLSFKLSLGSYCAGILILWKMWSKEILWALSLKYA